MKTGAALLGMLDHAQFGALLLDSNDAVVGMNRCAEQWLQRCASAPVSPGGDLNLWATAVLRRKIGTGSLKPGEIHSVNLGCTERRGAVLYRTMLEERLSNGACTVLVVIDLNALAPSSADVAQRVFALTKAEALLAVKLAAGMSLEEVAREHNVSLATARSHLKAVLSKTDTHRQAELVAVLARLSMLPSATPAGGENGRELGSAPSVSLPRFAGSADAARSRRADQVGG